MATVIAVVAVSWIVLFALIALFGTFMGSYSSPLDWWRHEISRKRR